MVIKIFDSLETIYGNYILDDVNSLLTIKCFIFCVIHLKHTVNVPEKLNI